MKKYTLFLLSILFISSGYSQQAQKDSRLDWWHDAGFGMFIHFGVYAQLGGVYKGHQQAHGGAEWIMNRCKIPVAEYHEVAKQFNPVKFDADKWVKTAKDAGMKYIVITAKHHDGFALFDTKASKWDIVDATPYKKDLLKPLSEACKKYGIKLGFYYSQAQDWNNPGGSAARKLMREGWPNPDSTKIDQYTKTHHGHWDPAQQTRSFEDYIDEVAVPQVKELLTNYGDVSVLWWDTPTGMTDEAAKKLQAQLKLQPDIITNDRLKRPNFPGDTQTPEQKVPTKEEMEGKNWETCMTMNHTWGYRKSDTDWKSTTKLIHTLVDVVSKGGNYLLNVGPKPDGTFPEASVTRLKEIGDWMDKNSEAIYGTIASPLSTQPEWGRCTMKTVNGDTILYLSVFDWPSSQEIMLPVKNKIKSVILLDNHKSLEAKQSVDGIKIILPKTPLYSAATVIKLHLEGEIQ